MKWICVDSSIFLRQVQLSIAHATHGNEDCFFQKFVLLFISTLKNIASKYYKCSRAKNYKTYEVKKRNKQKILKVVWKCLLSPLLFHYDC